MRALCRVPSTTARTRSSWPDRPRQSRQLSPDSARRGSLFAGGVTLWTDLLFARRRPKEIDLEENAPRAAGIELTLSFPEMALSVGMVDQIRAKPRVPALAAASLNGNVKEAAIHHRLH